MRILCATQIDGFQIVRRIGRGGAGEVFEAVRLGPGGFRRAVALKRLFGDHAIRGAAIERLLAEARVLARLDHPNIVRVLDVVTGDAGYVLVLELLDGAPLDQLVREAAGRGGLPLDRLLAIADQALAGLAYVHAATDENGRPLGLVHRDVTPRNLVITGDGTVKLLDFGIAKLRDALDPLGGPVTRDGEIHGTLELIAPEIARGEAADPRSDLYQLAACLYWALTGRYPHGTGTPAELVARAAGAAPPSIAELRPDLPAPLAGAIERAMASDRAQRFGDAGQMQEAMRAALAGGTVPTARRRRRWRWIAAAAGVAVAGGAAGWLAAPSGAPAMDRTVRLADIAIVAAATGERSAFGADRIAGGSIVFATGRELVVASPDGATRAIAVPDLLPYDVEHVVADGFVVTGLHNTGRWGATLVGAGEPRDLLLDLDRVVVAVSPRGDEIAYAEREAIGAKPIGQEEGNVRLIRGATDPDRRRTVLRIDRRERVTAIAWSPDGSRLAFVRHRGRGTDATIEVVAATGPTAAASQVVRSFSPDELVPALSWLDEGHLVVATRDAAGARLGRLAIATRDLAVLAEFPGEQIVSLRARSGRVVCVHGRLRRHLLAGRAGAMQPWIAELRAPDGRTGRDEPDGIAGVTPEGVVITRAGALAVIARGATASSRPVRGSAETLVDGAALVVRPDGAGAREVWRIEAGHGRAERKLTSTRAPSPGNAIRCAGDVTPPCVLADSTQPRRVHYWVIDPVTGERTRNLGRVDTSAHDGLGDHAVSPDGTTVAIVDEPNAIALWDLAGERRTRVRAPTYDLGGIEGIAWSGDRLLVSAHGWRGHPWALLTVTRTGEATLAAEARTRVGAEPRARGDDLAALVTDLETQLSVFDARP